MLEPAATVGSSGTKPLNWWFIDGIIAGYIVLGPVIYLVTACRRV